ncbi:MAG: HAD-IIB family hydrolase [Rhodospirillaceae bacterium]|nr:HAD-IIB family hydrolase [Rhodospirillaceae bacterium]
MTKPLPLAAFPLDARRRVRVVMTDIDDTLTNHGRLGAQAYGALERLRAQGFIVVPITGRPAGWCDHFARMWPVDAVVGENGAFWFRYDQQKRVMQRHWWQDQATRAANRERLTLLGRRILAEVPGSAIASDQAYRESDLAIDFCEDVPPLDKAGIDRIVALFEAAGAVAKVSSIHVNGWFGDWDKLAMARRCLAGAFGIDVDAAAETVVFSGDAPNDEPMFRFFPNAVGVANVMQWADRLTHFPAWITPSEGGPGFAELADALIAAR